MESDHNGNPDSLPSPSYRSATPQGSQHLQKNPYHRQMNADLNGDQDPLNPMALENEDDRISLMQRNHGTLMKGSNMNLSQQGQYFPTSIHGGSRPMPQGGHIYSSNTIGPNSGYIQGPNGEVLHLAPMTSQPSSHPFPGYDQGDLYFPPGAHPMINQPYIQVPRQQQTIAYDSCPAICSVFAIFCCPITWWCTVPALVYSICAYTDFKTQDWIRYRRRSDRARRLVIAACLTGLLLCIVFSVLLYLYRNQFVEWLKRVFDALAK